MPFDDEHYWEESDYGDRKCPYCRGGRIAVEVGSGQSYDCPDCGGTGRYIPEDEEDEDNGDGPDLP